MNDPAHTTLDREDTIITFFPLETGARPSRDALDRLADAAAALFPNARVTLHVREHLDVVPTTTFVGLVACTACGAELDGDDWDEAMSRAAATKFRDRTWIVPCCDAPIALEDLDYEYPIAFARVALEVAGVGHVQLDEVVRVLSEELGVPLRALLV